MLRGSISNIGAPSVWFMRDVLFDEEGVRADRADWLRRACVVIEVVVILKPNETIPETDLPLMFRVFRFLEDAQHALSRDSKPLFLVTENIDDLSKETFSFSENLLMRYNISLR